MTRSIWQEWYRLPGLLRIGLLLFTTGSGLDLVYHVAPATWASTMEAFLGVDGRRGHLMIMIGMALIVFGLVVEGALQRSRRERKEVRSESSH